jgi:hypothetical protein
MDNGFLTLASTASGHASGKNFALWQEEGVRICILNFVFKIAEVK